MKDVLFLFQENPYELQAAMEQQLRLEHNGSMDHQVIIDTYSETSSNSQCTHHTVGDL